jgi:predicted nucleic acid-binding protein
VIVFLDSGPLGLLAHSRRIAVTDAAERWLRALQKRGERVILPEIIDHEVRGELLRLGATSSVRRLDELKLTLDYLPLTTDVMLRAAELWAQARRRGRPTAADADLDCDVILAAQALLLAQAGEQPVIATTNVRHLSQFVDARPWQDVS